MRILISGGAGLLADALAAQLGVTHEVVANAARPGTAAGFEAVIRFVPQGRGESDQERLWNAAADTYDLVTTLRAGARFILVSTLAIFEATPPDWRVTEDWRPHPTTSIDDLVTHVTEAVVREGARALPIKGVVLRMGTVVAQGAEPDRRGVHVADAVRAVELALTFEPPAGYMWGWPQPRHGWWVFHITGAGPNRRFVSGMETRDVLGYAPRHDVATGAPAPEPMPPPAPLPPKPAARPIRNVVVFGAWGPLGAAVAERLRHHYRLRLCDVRSLDEALARPPAVRGDPRPRHLGPDHEERVVDITDPAQVSAAVEGMDAVVNVSVNRTGGALAFGVNMAGCHAIMTAVLAHGIRRIVQTGPEQTTDRQQGGHWSDFAIPSDASPRPGTRLYFLSKFLGQEICRIHAEAHGLEVAALLFGHLRDPRDVDRDTIEGMPIVVSWEDAAEAIRCALAVPTLPKPFEVFNVVADLPHDKVANTTAKERLGWLPKDDLRVVWTRAED